MLGQESRIDMCTEWPMQPPESIIREAMFINGDANKIKTELFNDIHEDSGSH